MQLEKLKKQLEFLKAKKFQIKHEYTHCSECGREYNIEKQNMIIERKRKQFENIKAANIKCLELEIRDYKKKNFF